jgi:hypothetical protein
VTLADVLTEVRSDQRRRFLPGLLVAFIDFLTELEAYGKGLKNFDDFAKAFPVQTETSGRAHANTLIVALAGGGTLSIRRFYNAFERLIRAKNKRFDYPNCAPHATQAWADYKKWFEPLLQASPDSVKLAREQVIKDTLERFPSHDFDPSNIAKEPLLFSALLEEFDFAPQAGEPKGAAFQGAVFGFIRADNPHLQVEIDKVGAGSSRLQRIGDIDAWAGDRLIISAEVKHFKFASKNVDDIAGFVGQIKARAALGIVVAEEFETDARDSIESEGLRARSLDDLVSGVSLWDPLKQRTAIEAFVYYVAHREKNTPLIKRVKGFLSALASALVASEAVQDGPKKDAS